jgi:putative ABC transport system substrate-binding protein
MRRIVTPLVAAAVALGSTGPALAQSSGKVWRLGVLTTIATGPPFDTFRSVMFPELARHGFVEGGNLAVEARIGPPDRLLDLARELLATRPDVVVAVSSWAVSAMQQVSSATPIVGSFIGVDPIAAGFATSLARPGGNVTGIVMLAPELDGKRVDVLHQAVPLARRIAALA